MSTVANNTPFPLFGIEGQKEKRKKKKEKKRELILESAVEGTSHEAKALCRSMTDLTFVFGFIDDEKIVIAMQTFHPIRFILPEALQHGHARYDRYYATLNAYVSTPTT